MTARSVGNYDMVPLLDEFVKERANFSILDEEAIARNDRI